MDRARARLADTALLLVVLISVGCGGDAGSDADVTRPPSPSNPSTTIATTPSPPATSGGYCIGDSVMVRAGPEHFDLLPMCGTVDAVVSRQMSDAPGVAATAAASGAPFVVIHLGTNGTIGQGDLDATLSALSDVPRVVLVTDQLGGGRSWEEPNNALLRAAPGRFGNVVVADWDAASEGQPALLADEYGHPTDTGAQVYARVIAEAL